MTGVQTCALPILLVVQFNNSVSLDFYENDADISSQHYAFLVSEDEFDQVLGRIRNRGLPYWAEPGKGKGRAGEVYEHNGGRGVYFEDPDGHLLEVMTRPYAIRGRLLKATPNQQFQPTRASRRAAEPRR